MQCSGNGYENSRASFVGTPYDIQNALNGMTYYVSIIRVHVCVYGRILYMLCLFSIYFLFRSFMCILSL